MLRNKSPTTEIDVDVLENYPSFTAGANINKTDKNIKQEEVFDRIINQFPPGYDTIYIGHDKKLTNVSPLSQLEFMSYIKLRLR